MRDELPDWMDPPAEDEPAPRRRMHRLLVLAAVPWVVVAVVVGWRCAAPPSDTAADAAPPAHEPAPAPTGQAAGASDAPAGDPDRAAVDRGEVADPSPGPEEPGAAGDEALVATEWRGGWREVPGDGASIAVALAVARAWLTGIGPVLEIEGIERAEGAGYAEHLTVEAIERPGPGAAVVTVSAVMLPAADAATAHLRRLAIPVDETGDDPRPGGAPWDLPVGDFEVARPAVTEDLGPEFWPAAEAALEVAGFTGVDLLDLQRTQGWPVLATIAVRDDAGGAEQTVWLRRHLDAFVVAGLPLTQALPDTEVTP